MTDISKPRYPDHSGIYQRHVSMQRRKIILLSLLFLCAVFLFLIDILAGASNLTPMDLLQGLVDPDRLSAVNKVIIFDIRLPTACLAILVGASLAISGVEIQTVLENPLASPFTLGISSAAALGASLGIIAGIGLPFLPERWLIPGNAFLFAMLSILLLQTLNRLKGGGTESLVLFGISMVFAFSALLSIVQLFASAQAVQMIVFWTMGSVERADWVDVSLLATFLLLIFPWSFHSANKLTALRFGADRAQTMGINVKRLRLLSQIRVSLLTGLAVALTGTIAFVGLVGPHIARLLLGENHKLLLPASALMGAILMSAASIASKILIPGVSIPVGVVTAVIGVPVFITVIITRVGRK